MSEDIDVSKLSLEDRCTHKAWKVRLDGYEEILKLFAKCNDSPKGNDFSKYGGLLKNFVSETNVVAQEKGLEAVLCLLQNAHPSIATKYIYDIVPNLIAKCFTTKPKAKQLATDCLLQCIELEKQEYVIDELIKGLTNKTPKVVIGSLDVLKEAIRGFGPKIITVKPILKQVPTLLDHRDSNIRLETKQLIKTVYQWLGDVIKPALQGLKPIHLQELELMFSTVMTENDRITKQTLWTRIQKAQMLAAANAAAISMDGGPTSQNSSANPGVITDSQTVCDTEIDPFDLIEAVDVLSALPRKFYDEIADKSWQVRKQALESLKDILAPPKYESNGDYHELVKTLRTCIAKDTNILAVILAAENLTRLAMGLRKKFGSMAQSCVSTILEKFKEKKPTVITALRAAIDAIYPTTTFDNISEDVIAAIGNKNPAVRNETMSFLHRIFTTYPDMAYVALANPTQPSTKKLLKTLVTTLITASSDSDPHVRESTIETLADLLKIGGDKVMLPLLSDLDKAKLDKVKELSEKSEIKLKPIIPQAVGQHNNINATSRTKNQEFEPTSSATLQKGFDIDINNDNGGSGGVLDSNSTNMGKPKKMIRKTTFKAAPSGIQKKKIGSSVMANNGATVSNSKSVDSINDATEQYNHLNNDNIDHNMNKNMNKIMGTMKSKSNNPNKGGISTNNRISMSISNLAKKAGGISPPSTQTGTAVDNNVTEISAALLSNNATINLANNLFNANATRQAKMGRLKAWKPIASSWLNGIVNSGSIGGIGSSGGGGPMSGGGSAGSGGGGCGPGSGPGAANASARALGEAATSLRDGMEPLLGNSVVKSCLFHKDFRYQIKGMDTLNQCLTEILNAIHRPIPNNEENNGYSGQSIIDFEAGVNCFERIFLGSDLLIRWCIIRLCDSSNPALMLKCLDFLTHLFEILHVLQQQQQRQLNNDNGVTASSCPSLNDTEVTCLATVITVRCFGDKDLVRKAGRLAFQSLAQVVCTNNSSSTTTAGKLIWSAGLDILKTTKNAKQKQDMLEEMTNMLKTYHVNQILACSTSSSMFIATIKTVGPVLNDRIVLRNCAFNLFAALFNQCGDIVFKHLSSSETFSNTHVTAMLALENKIRKIAASTPSFVNSPPIDSTTNVNNNVMTTLNTNNVGGTQNVNEINHAGVMPKTKTPISNSRLSMPSKMLLQSSDMLSQTPAYNDDLATISQNQLNSTNSNNTQFMNQFPSQLNNNNILTTSLISPQARRSYVKNVLNSLVSQQHMVNSPARQTNLTLQEIDGLSTPHKRMTMATNNVQTPKLPVIDVTKQGLANLRLYDTSEADNILAEPVIFPAAFKRTPPTGASNHSQYGGGGSSVSSMMMENTTTTEFSSKNPSLSSPALPGIKSEHSQLIKQNGIHQLSTTTNTFDTNKFTDNNNVVLNQPLIQIAPCPLHSLSMYEQLHALTLSWHNNSTLLDEESSAGRMVKFDYTHCVKGIESTEIWIFGQRQAQTTHHNNTAANENVKDEMKCTCWELNGAKLFSTTLNALTLTLKACYGKIFGDTTPTNKDVNKPLTDLADAYIQDCTRILNFLLHFMAIPLTPLSYHDKHKTVIWLGNCNQMKELLDALLIILSKASSTVAFMKTYNLMNNDNTAPYNNLNALVRKLNIILVKIIEMSAFGPILSSLLSLFIGAVECVLAFENNAQTINDNSNNNINDSVHKNFILQKDTKQQYMGLIMKCIWKAIKLLPLSMSSLLSTYNRENLLNNNVSKTQTYLYDILKQSDIFMTKYPTVLWKKRLTSQQYQQQHNSNIHENEHNPSNNSNATGNGDTPMRTIKTLVHSLTMLCGTCILDYISSHPLNTANKGQETYVFSSELHMYITKVLRVITAPSVNQTNNHNNTPTKNEIHNNNLPIDNCIAPQNDGKSSTNNVFYSPAHEQGKQKQKISVVGTANYHNSDWPPQCLTLSSNHDRNTIQAILNEFDRGDPVTFESTIHALHEFGVQRPNFDLRNYVWIHVSNILLRDAILHALATYNPNQDWEKCEAYHTYFTCQPTQPNVTKATSLKYFEKHWGGIMGGHQKFLQVLAPSSLQSNAAKFPSPKTNDAAHKKRDILSTEACKQKINQHLTFLDNLPGEWKMSAGQN